MDAVGAVLAPTDEQHRQQVVEQLREEYGDPFDMERLGSVDNWTIVDVCIQHNVVPDLVTVLKFVVGSSSDWHRLDDVVKELFTPSTALAINDELDVRLRALLAPVAIDLVADALTHEAVGRINVGPADVRTAVDAYVLLQSQREYLSLLCFLEILAHHLENDAALEMRHLIDELATRSALSDDAQEMRRSLRPGGKNTPASSPGELTEEGPESDDNDSDGGTVRSPDVRNDLAGSRVLPKVWGGVPPRNNNFTGRAELLEQVHAALDRHTQSALVPQPLHGLGGIGKSQLAVEFAYRHQYDYELVWWIQADDEQSIRRSLSALAKRLDIAESDDVQEIVDRVLDALRLGEPYPSWLLIYDNAPEPAVVQRYLPRGPGHVLVTSRSRSWSGVPNAIEIDVFTPQESIELLRNRWSELTEDRALVLAHELGHLPLALEQAIAVHEQTGMPLQDYLRALEESPKVILDEGVPANYPHTVAAALELAYSSVRETSPAAAYLLELCSFLSSHPISIPMLARGRNAQPMAELRDDILLRRAVRDLGRYALVQLDAGRDFIRVHALIRAVLRDSLPTEERDAMQQAAHAVLAASNPGAPDDPDTWPQHGQIAPHVEPAGLFLSDDDNVRRMVLDQIRYHYAIGDYRTSEKFGRRTVDSWRARYGENDELTLVARRHLSTSLRLLGNYAEAGRLNNDTLSRMRKAFGDDHEHTLATASSVGADLRLAGQFGSALNLDQDTLDKNRRVLGGHDPATLRALNNLAVDYRMRGDFETALTLDNENVALRQGIYGADHPRTLFSYTCLMRDLYGIGQYHQGLAIGREKMPIYEQKMPPNHGEVLIAKRSMAILLRKMGHNDEALSYTKTLYDSCRRKFGRRHEHTLSAMVTLSNAYRVNGDVARALRLGEEALAAYRDVFDTTHAFTFGCQVNVAIALRLAGRKDEANALNEDALTNLATILGEDHPYTMCAANTKSNGLAADGRVEEARALGERTLELSRRVRGDLHPNTLSCAANLALDLEKVGELVEANQLRRETLDQLGIQLGADHPATMNAGVYRRMESDVEVPAT